MSRNRRSALTLVLFVAVLSLLVAANSRLIDTAVAVIVLAALLVGSAVLVTKSLRSGSLHYGQLSAVPRSWRRWILDEEEHPRENR